MSTNFTFTPLSMGGVYKIELRRFGDTRGFFKELYHKENFLARGISDEFIQDNFSYSHKNVIRGLHVRKVPHQESKLVSCTLGEIFDVIVDVRAGSPTFGTWEALTLSADNDVSVYIPSGCAHGFLVMSDGASVQYKVTSSYNPEWDGGIRWDDADVEVDWPIINPIVSEKDMALPTLKENIKEGWIQK